MKWLAGILVIALITSAVEVSLGFKWIDSGACETSCCLENQIAEPLDSRDSDDDCTNSNCDPILCCTTVWLQNHQVADWQFANFSNTKDYSSARLTFSAFQLYSDIWQPPKL